MYNEFLVRSLRVLTIPSYVMLMIISLVVIIPAPTHVIERVMHPVLDVFCSYLMYFVVVTLLFQLLAMFSCFTMQAICQQALDTHNQFVIHHIVSLTILTL